MENLPIIVSDRGFKPLSTDTWQIKYTPIRFEANWLLTAKFHNIVKKCIKQLES